MEPVSPRWFRDFAFAAGKFRELLSRVRIGRDYIEHMKFLAGVAQQIGEVAEAF